MTLRCDGWSVHDVGSRALDGCSGNTASAGQLSLCRLSQRCIGVETGRVRIHIRHWAQLQLLAWKCFAEWNLQLNNRQQQAQPLDYFTDTKCIISLANTDTPLTGNCHFCLRTFLRINFWGINTIPCDMRWYNCFTCAWKLTEVSLVYRKEPVYK